MTLSLLGPLHVRRAGTEIALPASRKARGLLAYLIMAPRPLHRSRLCEIFWDLPNDPRGELRWCLSKIRHVVDEPACKRVRSGKDFIAIETATLAVDALRIDQEVEAALASTDMAALERLAALFKGAFLDGETSDRMPLFEAWLESQRDRFRTLHLKILSRMIELLPDGSERRFACLRKRIEIVPGDVASHRDLLTALAGSGRLAEGQAHLALAVRLLKSDGLSGVALEKMWQVTRQQRALSQDVPAPVADEEQAAPGAPVLLATLQPKAAAIQNLPPQLTSYIRRDAEETEVRSRLRAHRLVTLVGPGGAGKTRLAIEIGRGLLAEVFDGIWMVELAALNDPQLVGEALCSCIGVAFVDGRTASDSAAAYLRDRRALVILDNCEHLIDVVAEVTLTLLRACPTLLILTTSRERLGVPGESTYPVPGLGLPASSGPIAAATAREHDAIRLFEERARTVIQGFAVTDANAEAVRDICRQLDGFPMAIELVVPQLRMVQPDGLAARLHDRVLLVMKGERGVLPRHRTLSALFDWSYNLLSEAERALFRRLSVFNGGWSLEAAAAVTVDAVVAPDEVFDLLSRLIDKSLVVADMRRQVPRYNFLQTTRQYALLKLVESGETDVRSRLLDAMIDLFVTADAAWSRTPTERWLATVEPDLDNLRSCLDWAFGPASEAARGVTLCAYSLRIWDELALLSERERWFSTAFERRDAATPTPVMARLWLGRISNSAHGDRSNFALAERAAELFAEAGDAQGRGEALAKAGAALATPDTAAEALPLLDDASRVLSPLGATKPLASCLRSIAVARYFDHDFAGARGLLAQSETVARTVGDLRGVAAVQIAAAELAFLAGEPGQAIAQINTMLAADHCNRRQRVLGLTNLVSYLLACDRVAEGRLAARNALREARALDWRAAIVRLVEHLALVTALDGDHAAAAMMLGHGVAFYAGGTASREYTELATYDRLTALLTPAMPPERLAQLMAEGARWSGDQAAQHATAIAGA